MEQYSLRIWRIIQVTIHKIIGIIVHFFNLETKRGRRNSLLLEGGTKPVTSKRFEIDEQMEQIQW